VEHPVKRGLKSNKQKGSGYKPEPAHDFLFGGCLAVKIAWEDIAQAGFLQ
jgi:hypothetical protein